MTKSSIFDVLIILEHANVYFRIDRNRPDKIRADAIFYRIRVEIDFFKDNHVEISTFRGNEDVEGGYEYIKNILSEHASD